MYIYGSDSAIEVVQQWVDIRVKLETVAELKSLTLIVSMKNRNLK